MAFLAFLPEQTQPSKKPSNKKKKTKKSSKQPVSSWDQFKNLLTCKQIEEAKIHRPSRNIPVYSSCGSICTINEANRVVHRSDNSPETSNPGQETRLLSKKNGSRSSAYARSVNSSCSMRSNSGVSSRSGMQFRKLSGCYECHAILDPTMYPLPRTTICACPDCGEVFPKIESLEHHQAVKHAVSELGPEDSSRNIVEIIFKSSWLKKDNPICKIERILKVHNSQRTIQRFEDYRDTVKLRATANTTKKNARCAADGNELLRFHCATLLCNLGTRGSSSLCGSGPGCGVCAIIRHGFAGSKVGGISTTASSGRAHDNLGGSGTRRAMLVCRVIAGRTKRVEDDEITADGAAFDSVALYGGMYSNLDELFVFHSRAILPCFVVIYKALDN